MYILSTILILLGLLGRLSISLSIFNPLSDVGVALFLYTILKKSRKTRTLLFVSVSLMYVFSIIFYQLYPIMLSSIIAISLYFQRRKWVYFIVPSFAISMIIWVSVYSHSLIKKLSHGPFYYLMYGFQVSIEAYFVIYVLAVLASVYVLMNLIRKFHKFTRIFLIFLFIFILISYAYVSTSWNIPSTKLKYVENIIIDEDVKTISNVSTKNIRVINSTVLFYDGRGFNGKLVIKNSSVIFSKFKFENMNISIENSYINDLNVINSSVNVINSFLSLNAENSKVHIKNVSTPNFDPYTISLYNCTGDLYNIICKEYYAPFYIYNSQIDISGFGWIKGFNSTIYIKIPSSFYMEGEKTYYKIYGNYHMRLLDNSTHNITIGNKSFFRKGKINFRYWWNFTLNTSKRSISSFYTTMIEDILSNISMKIDGENFEIPYYWWYTKYHRGNLSLDKSREIVLKNEAKYNVYEGNKLIIYHPIKHYQNTPWVTINNSNISNLTVWNCNIILNSSTLEDSHIFSKSNHISLRNGSSLRNITLNSISITIDDSRKILLQNVTFVNVGIVREVPKELRNDLENRYNEKNYKWINIAFKNCKGYLSIIFIIKSNTSFYHTILVMDSFDFVTCHIFGGKFISLISISLGGNTTASNIKVYVYLLGLTPSLYSKNTNVLINDSYIKSSALVILGKWDNLNVKNSTLVGNGLIFGNISANIRGWLYIEGKSSLLGYVDKIYLFNATFPPTTIPNVYIYSSCDYIYIKSYRVGNPLIVFILFLIILLTKNRKLLFVYLPVSFLVLSISLTSITILASAILFGLVILWEYRTLNVKKISLSLTPLFLFYLYPITSINILFGLIYLIAFIGMFSKRRFIWIVILILVFAGFSISLLLDPKIVGVLEHLKSAEV